MSEFLVELEGTNSQTTVGVYKAKYAYRAAQKSQRKALSMTSVSTLNVRVTDSKSRQTFYELFSENPSESQVQFGLTRKIVSRKRKERVANKDLSQLHNDK